MRLCPFVRFLLVTAVVFGVTEPSVPTSAQTDLVTYHDLSTMKPWPLGKMQVKGAMGEVGSIGIAELPDGLRGNAHHHNQEQIVLGLSGMTEMTVDGTTHRLGVHGAVVTPANTQHSNANAGSGTAVFIEFQSVLRTDWFPPHQKFVPPVAAAPAPLPVPRGRQVFSDLSVSSDGWHTHSIGARSKILNGQTIRLTMWDLSAASALAIRDSKGTRPEQFVYAIEGQLQITIDGSRREMTPQTLAVISPAAKAVQLRSVSKGRTLAAVFETAP